jgi:hypothetical protein
MNGPGALPGLRRRAALFAWIGLGLCLAAPVVWYATLDRPWLRATGAAAFACAIAGTALGWYAARRDPRRWIRVLAALDALALGALAWAGFGISRLPRVEAARALAVAPDFALLDHLGREVRLSAELARGPVLLVFYRGHW